MISVSVEKSLDRIKHELKTEEPTFQAVCKESKSNVYISLLSSQNVISDGSEERNTGINSTWEYNAQGVDVLFLNFF